LGFNPTSLIEQLSLRGKATAAEAIQKPMSPKRLCHPEPVIQHLPVILNLIQDLKISRIFVIVQYMKSSSFQDLELIG